MKANLKQIKKRRFYSEEIKRSLVKDFETGNFSVGQLERLHGIKSTIIYRWIYKYSTHNEKGSRIVEMAESSTNKQKQLEQRIKELEQIIGQKQIKIDYLEKLIDIAEDELKTDIKKNFNTPQSVGSIQKNKR